MKEMFAIFAFLMPLALVAQNDSVAGKVYTYQKPVPIKDNIADAILFKGSTYDLSEVKMASSIISGSKKIQLQHASGECLLIVKSGTLLLRMKDSSWVLDKGSIALIMPGENYVLQNTSAIPCEFYTMTYASKKQEDKQRGTDAGESAVVKWNDVAFNAHDKGGIRRFLDRPTVMLQHFEIHASTLKQGLKSHEPHTHRAAEIVVMLEGHTEMQIGNNFYKGNAGDVYYLPSNAPHAIRNNDNNDCMYFAFQFQ